MKSIRRPLLAGITVLVLLAAFGFVKQPDVPAQANNIYRLQAPPFLSVARAEEESITSVIEDEAGIAAYFQAATPIDMVSVRDVFRTIEYENDDYIIGSVEVTNYPESEDVHVYVHVDGWILAYYLAADPVGKIYDWIDYYNSGHTNLTTRLENIIAKVATYAVVSYSDCAYYDFRNPNANHLMLIAEWVGDGTDSFDVTLPGTFSYYERSWSLGNDPGGPYGVSASYSLDGTVIASQEGGWKTSQGTLEPSQLLLEQPHLIEVWVYAYGGGAYGYGGLALIYKVP